MKKISTTPNLFASFKSIAKGLLLAAIVLLPFLSWGQQQGGTPINLPTSYVYYGGDTLNGFDLYSTYNQLSSGGAINKELAVMMYHREKEYVNKKYNIVPKVPPLNTAVHAFKAHAGADGRPGFTIDWDEMNKINAERAKYWPAARDIAYGVKRDKKPQAAGCGNLDMADGGTAGNQWNNWSGIYAFNGDDVPASQNGGPNSILYYLGNYPAGWQFTTSTLNGQEAAPPASNATPITKGLDASAATSCSWVTLCDGAAGTDPCSSGYPGQFNEVCPGFNYSMRLGGATVNLGPGYMSAIGMSSSECGTGAALGTGNGTDDDPEGLTANYGFGKKEAYTGQGEFMTDSLLITSSNCLLTINFAGVLNTGGNSHTDEQQPWAGFQALSAGVPVNCLYYFQEATGAVPAGYTQGNGINPYIGNTSQCYFVPWTPIAFDCHQYIGKYIALQFFAVGCEPGAHFSYFYFDVSCGPELLTVTNPSCGTGTITGPPGATSYKWTGPCITSGANAQVVTVGCTGSYTCITNLTGTGGCNDTIVTPVTINANPTITASATAATICSGAGGTTLTASGAGGGGTYSWSAGTTPGTGASVTVNPGVGTTTYTVTGTTSGLGCVGTGTVSVKVNATPTVTSIGAAPSSTICAGKTVTLTANPSGSTYAWTSSGAATTPATGDVVTATPTVTTTYSVVATKTGCASAIQTLTVTVNPTPTVSVSAGAGTICSGQSTQLTASPSGLSSYTWTPNIPVSLTNTNQDTTTASPVVTTVYTVIAVDANGCTNTAAPATVTVNVNTSPTVSVGSSVPSDSICSGGSVILTASGASTYSWNTTPVQTTSAITVSPITTTTYVVTVASAAGCSVGAGAVDTVIIHVTTTPTVTVGPTPSPFICPGDSVHLYGIGATTYTWNPGNINSDSLWVKPGSTATYTVIGNNGKCSNGAGTTVTVTVGTLTVGITSAHGTTICSGVPDTLTANGGATSYLWSTGETTSAIVVNPSINDTVSVIGSSGSGCTANDTIRLVVNTTPTVTSVNVNDSSGTVCTGDTTQAFVNVTGGGPYTYSWAPSGGTHDTAYGLGAGTYTVTVTSASGCASLTTNTVTISTKNIVVTATASGGGSICSGGSSTILTASGANNYVWHTAPGLTDTIYDTATAFPVSTTTYTVVGTTTGTCIGTATVTVTVNTTPAIILNVSRDTAVCSGGSITMTASGATSYAWSPTTYLNPSLGTSATEVSTPTGLITYIVTGTGAGGCTATDTVTVNVVPSPTITITASGGNDTVCNGKSVTLTASGASGNTYLWTPGSSTNASVTVTPASSPETYTVESTNAGCSVKTTQDVYIFPALTISMLPTVAGCSGQPVTIGASVSGGNPLPGYTYSWSPNVGTGPGPFTIPSAAQTYTCTVTDGCGATAIGTTQVTVSPTPVACFAPMPTDSVLAGGYISFVNCSNNWDSTSAHWYWTFGDGGTAVDSFPYYQYNVAGTYTVTLYDTTAAGCGDTAKHVVTVKQWIFIPNVFTPNGDGINDVFHVTAASMKTYSIEIFNRWGERVFSADNPAIDWTGRSTSGVMESDGTYYYKIIAADYAGHNYNLDGYIQLIGSGNLGGSGQ